MTYAELNLLANLGGVALVALMAVLLLIRRRPPPRARRSAVIVGYPADCYRDREAVRSAPLVALAATQARLLSMHEQIPAHTDLAIWLHAFLRELREVMDTAYRVATITAAYSLPGQLEYLIDQVQQIETQVAERVARQLLQRDGDAHDELLEGRLATLRMCLRELAVLPDPFSSILV